MIQEELNFILEKNNADTVQELIDRNLFLIKFNKPLDTPLSTLNRLCKFIKIRRFTEVFNRREYNKKYHKKIKELNKLGL